jgi:hypothetical protein
MNLFIIVFLYLPTIVIIVIIFLNYFLSNNKLIVKIYKYEK